MTGTDPLHQDGVVQRPAGLLVQNETLHGHRLGHLGLKTHLTRVILHVNAERSRVLRAIYLGAEAFPEPLVRVEPHASVLPQKEAPLNERTQHFTQHLHQFNMRKTVVRSAHIHLTQTEFQLVFIRACVCVRVRALP